MPGVGVGVLSKQMVMVGVPAGPGVAVGPVCAPKQGDPLTGVHATGTLVAAPLRPSNASAHQAHQGRWGTFVPPFSDHVAPTHRTASSVSIVAGQC